MLPISPPERWNRRRKNNKPKKKNGTDSNFEILISRFIYGIYPSAHPSRLTIRVMVMRENCRLILRVYAFLFQIIYQGVADIGFYHTALQSDWYGVDRDKYNE